MLLSQHLITLQSKSPASSQIEPLCGKKDEAELAALEAALAAPKLPVKPSPFASTSSSPGKILELAGNAARDNKKNRGMRENRGFFFTMHCNSHSVATLFEFFFSVVETGRDGSFLESSGRNVEIRRERAYHEVFQSAPPAAEAKKEKKVEERVESDDARPLEICAEPPLSETKQIYCCSVSVLFFFENLKCITETGEEKKQMLKKMQDLLLEISALEIENKDNAERLQSKIQIKEEETDALRKENEKHEQHLDLLEKQLHNHTYIYKNRQQMERLTSTQMIPDAFQGARDDVRVQSAIVTLLRLAVAICLIMSLMLFIERVYMGVVIMLVKLFGRKPADRRYRWEAMKDDVEVGNSTYPMVLVQIPMYNERELSIGAACGLSWPSDRVIIQVLDGSTDPTIKDMVELECQRWAIKGINIKYEIRDNRNGYKSGALKEGMKRSYVKSCDYVAIFDADFQPEPDFLRRTIPFLVHNPELALVQTRWKFGNLALITTFSHLNLVVITINLGP
ncbi:hypothetical protein DKX38_028790 [Salix brachista]|uniref:Glycosyltransferase 2-like domain-containing protein n=1 Tax=Salix brachista TaxID=2182728 RepID=A0A5N5IZ31_9ROSI|nr:hypothetical protein DKX38_028790 [Salix brachista]